MVSFDDVLSDESQPNAVSSGEVFRRTPEEQVLDRESADEIIQAYSRCLSKFEAEILGLFLHGLSYSEIAEECGRTEKSVDNAVQRIRRKLARNLYLSDISGS
ncbi:MAG: sigma factor-like helix-turn-helix DNA-binding protein [Oscillospiraceae bacterium]